MTIGPRAYGLGAIALGIPGLIHADFAVLGQPVPTHLWSYHLLAAAGWLVVAGLAINLRRTAGMASLMLAAFFALWLAVLHLPNAFAQPMVWVSWESVAENMVMALGGVLAWTLTREETLTRADNVARVARPLFGVCLLVFGTSEFVYSSFTASLVPAWLPPSTLFWTYLTGAAQITAGLAILSTLRARLAAMLLTTMYLIFGLIVHLPRVIADPSTPAIWGENGVNLVLAGAAWVLVDSLARAKRRSDRSGIVSTPLPT